MSNPLALATALTGVLLYSAVIHAQNHANTPTRIIVPSSPAGPTDFAARVIASKLSEALGRNVIVDNRPSVNGVLAAELAARATPDGSTLMMGNSGTHAINAALYRKLRYDPQRDFAPISEVISSGFVLVSHPKLAASSFSDFVTLAKKQPAKLNMGIPGATAQLAGEALKAQAGITLNNVPYKGSSPTELAMLSGEVEVALLTPIATVGHVNTGKLKALGVTSAKRTVLLPHVATIAESGIDGYEFEIWHGLFAPAGTSERTIRTWHREVARVLEVPQVKERFVSQGFDIVGKTPEEFASVILREIQKYRKIVAEAGIPLE